MMESVIDLRLRRWRLKGCGRVASRPPQPAIKMQRKIRPLGMRDHLRLGVSPQQSTTHYVTMVWILERCHHNKTGDGVWKEELGMWWQKDKSTHGCTICKVRFSLLLRRHHCRFCGDVVCATCIQKKTLHPKSGAAELICSRCFRDLEEFHSRAQSQPTNSALPPSPTTLLPVRPSTRQYPARLSPLEFGRLSQVHTSRRICSRRMQDGWCNVT